jgi:predicted Zn-dependent protease
MCDLHRDLHTANNGKSNAKSGGGLSRRRFLSRAVIAGAGLAAAPLLLTPSAARADAFFPMPSPDDQKRVGDQAARQVLQQYKEVRDSRARHFGDLGRRLVSALPPQDQRLWDYRFHVIDSPEVNAFALPGGSIFLFTGLYDQIHTEDALAAVTGHEMTHVRKQHWAQGYVKQQEREAGIGLLLGLFHAGQAVQTVAGLADSAIGLKFSRGEEDQADAGGLDDMVAAGYDPQGMLQLFGTLQKVAGNGGEFGTDFLSNHPLTSDRIKHTQQRIAALSPAGFGQEQEFRRGRQRG